MDREIKFSVKGNEIVPLTPSVCLMMNENLVTRLSFTFDEVWTGHDKTINIVGSNGATLEPLLLENDGVLIPQAAVLAEGSISFSLEKADGNTVYPTRPAMIPVLYAVPQGIEDIPTYENLISQTVAAKNGALEVANISIAVQTLAPGSPATATLTDGEAAKVLTLGIPQGATGQPGAQGKDGIIGADGKSAYQHAVDGGYTGTELEFNNMLNQMQTYSENLSNKIIEYLVIGGGGGGGSCRGGGGGGGGLKSGLARLAEGSYTVTVGSGGTGGTGGNPPASMAIGMGQNGENSSISNIVTAHGGGGGAVGTAPLFWATSVKGNDGGCGGGGSGGNPVGNGGSGTSDEGFAGGVGVAVDMVGGGGGSPCFSADANGNGANGYCSDISGTKTFYAGGGAGGAYESASRAGGSGGGGGGVKAGTIGNNGTNGLGGGGGGGGNIAKGGNGGSGIVIIRYLTGTLGICTGGQVSVEGNYTIHTFLQSGVFTYSV